MSAWIWNNTDAFQASGGGAGGLVASFPSPGSATIQYIYADQGMDGANKYLELAYTTQLGGHRPVFGVARSTANRTLRLGGDVLGWGLAQLDGTFRTAGGSSVAYGAAVPTGRVIGVNYNGAILTFSDATGGGTTLASVNIGAGLTLFPAVSADDTAGGIFTVTLNAGRSAFVNLPTGASAADPAAAAINSQILACL